MSKIIFHVDKNIPDINNEVKANSIISSSFRIFVPTKILKKTFIKETLMDNNQSAM